jgi:hypothetical protein
MLMPGSPHTAGHGNRGRLWRPSRGEHSCKRPVIAGLSIARRCRKNDLAVQVPQRLRSQFVALGQSITRHPCRLPFIASPARPL